MTVSLTHTKSAKLKQRCIDILQTDMASIQSLAELIGHLVAALPGVLFGTIFIKQLKIIKIKSLAKNKGNNAAFIRLTDEVKADIQWWTDHITESAYPVRVSKPSVVIKTDASKTGGGVMVDELEVPGQPKRLCCT